MKKDYIIYSDDELSILNVHNLPNSPAGNGIDHIAIGMALGGLRAMYEAHEIWLYNKINRTFSRFKSRTGDGRLLKSCLSNIGITLRVDAACLNTAEATTFRFDTERDFFLFKLKYGIE